MKRVYLARNPADAHLLRGILESHHIQAVVHGDFLWSARGEVPLTVDTSPSVWVQHDIDFERASEVVRQFQSQISADAFSGADWTCGHCGETNEGQFSECWQCGTGRD
ncbi:MAG: DUF2007 domain-containing protein [Smithellaceae bacterium]